MPQPGVSPAEQSTHGLRAAKPALAVTLACSQTEVWTCLLHSFPRNEARNEHIRTQELHVPEVSAESISMQK